MDKKTHARFIEVSSTFSKNLADDIRAVGPVDFPDRKYGSLTLFLSRAVVGQQLSLKAARTIWGRIEEAKKESGSRVPGFFREENKELAGMPWYQNYRVLTGILLVLIAVIIVVFW